MPVILFYEDDRDNILSKTKKHCEKAGIPFVILEDEDAALKARLNKAHQELGVFVLHKDFCRGFDLKLRKDAYVMIYTTQNGYPLNVVEQMVGRGSRAFGQGSGGYFTTEFMQTTESIAPKLKQKEIQMGDAYIQVGMLYRVFKDLSSYQQQQFYDVLKEGKWKMSRVLFQASQAKLFDILKTADRKKKKKDEIKPDDGSGQ